MQIRDIVPVSFPVLPLPYEQERKITAAVSKAIKGPIEHPTETMSICKNISKIFRFGWDSCHPKTGISNKEHLEEEIGDLLCMVDILVEKCIISDHNINSAREVKRIKLKEWSRIKL